MEVAARTTVVNTCDDDTSEYPSCDPFTRPQQSILQVTLAGPSLILTLATLVITVHILSPSVMATLFVLMPLPYIINNDFKAFLSLGPGGTPSTFTGYLKITYLRFFALRDPFTPPCITGSITPQKSFFQSTSTWLPHRRGPRPQVAGIAPQRQLDQFGDKSAYLSLRSSLRAAAKTNPHMLRTAVSCFEKQGLALFALNPVNRTCNGEICHVHATDKSLHLNLHPADAKVVLERGWGQRHPLAKGGWLGRYVPREFVMVYAPRSKEECEIITTIVAAAAWWVMGERAEIALCDEKEKEGVTAP
jgi:hypothetical protein